MRALRLIVSVLLVIALIFALAIPSVSADVEDRM